MDVAAALLILTLFALPMAAIGLLVRMTSKGRALFSQERVGRMGRLFRIFKFRSMEESRGSKKGPGLSREGDSRITPVGRVLRRLKLDELPQFYNVLRGNMSLIGPRPKLPEYAGISNMPYRPGITGPASLVFRREEELLRGIHPEKLKTYYDENIKPLKAQLDVCYMCSASPRSDLVLLVLTFTACLAPGAAPCVNRDVPKQLPFTVLYSRRANMGRESAGD